MGKTECSAKNQNFRFFKWRNGHQMHQKMEKPGAAWKIKTSFLMVSRASLFHLGLTWFLIGLERDTIWRNKLQVILWCAWWYTVVVMFWRRHILIFLEPLIAGKVSNRNWNGLDETHSNPIYQMSCLIPYTAEDQRRTAVDLSSPGQCNFYNADSWGVMRPPARLETRRRRRRRAYRKNIGLLLTSTPHW